MLDDLALLHQRHSPQCSARVAKYFEGYCTIQLASAGEIELSYDDSVSRLQAPVVWTCFPGPFISFHPAEPAGSWEHRYLAFLGPRVARWRSEGLWFEGAMTLSSVLASRLIYRFDEAIATADQADRFGSMRAIALLDTILIDLADAREERKDENPPWLVHVMAELADLSQPEPSYSRLARRHGIALSTLRSRFKQATGIALHSYRLQCRITQARTLLANTQQPVKQIAASLGYNDVYYFTRQFARHVGLPPVAYRKSKQS